jgi:hypothetical protein
LAVIVGLVAPVVDPQIHRIASNHAAVRIVTRGMFHAFEAAFNAAAIPPPRDDSGGSAPRSNQERRGSHRPLHAQCAIWRASPWKDVSASDGVDATGHSSQDTSVFTVRS